MVKLKKEDLLLKNIHLIQEYQFIIKNSFLLVHLYFMQTHLLSIIKHQLFIRHSVSKAYYQFLAQQV